MQIALRTLLGFLPCFLAGWVSAQEPPVIAVGLDAYRQWERWPYQRIGARAYMRSTYDRTGGNEGADASHFLFHIPPDQHVTLDLEGSGVLYFVRTNHWHGSPWHYIFDGNDQVVQETSTADPLHPTENSSFLPADLFPQPLAWTWSTTRGADLNWVPIPFEKSLRLAYSRTCYGTGYYIYHKYAPGTKLTQPIRTWAAKPPDRDVLELINRAGQDVAPPGDEVVSGSRNLSPELPIVCAIESAAPRTIRAIQISSPRERARDLSGVRLRIHWDGRRDASVDCPLPLFFGAGTLYNREQKEVLVKAFPVNIRFEKDRVHLACYFPMPFFRSARVELASSGPQVRDIRLSIRTLPYSDPPNDVGYFHATYRDHPKPEPGQDLVLLDTRQIEGSEHWTGSFVGTSLIFSHNAVLNTLEGDPRFFFDDSSTPQAQGTGTEEWGGGGDYWGGRTMSLPFAGHPVGAPNAKGARSDEDRIESAYRFLLADLFPFGRNARITLEHGGTNESTEHYETIAYWYGLPGASLVLSDELQIADEVSERSHGYVSATASSPVQIISRYELGVDTLKGKELFPPHSDKGRVMTGTSEFTMKLDSKNLGVLLRRKLDYSYPNQRAEVFIANASGGNEQFADADFKPAGVWYLAGSNVCYYSRPNGELDPPKFELRESNRRFRDDEFLIGRSLTRGRSAIRVRIRFTPVSRPLFPGMEVAKPAWSEIHYWAYSLVMPEGPTR